MSNKKFVDSKIVDKNILESKYLVGNSVYVVNSHFAGKEKLEDLYFDILNKKVAVNSAEISSKA